MKTFPSTKTALAVLTSQSIVNTKASESLAVLTFTDTAINAEQSNRVQILPDGYFTPTDGREVDVSGGKWLMDAQAFASLSANLAQRSNDLLFDYEHQTLNSDSNGKPAPAAGWFKKLDYVPGQGLFAVDVDWTAPAAQFIKNKEYRYTSAVFSYDKNSGRPIALMHVALTNNPALDGMKAITALKAISTHSINPSTNETGAAMNAATQLLALLGVTVASDADITDEQLTQGTVALKALQTKADQSGQLEKDLNTAQTSVTALKAKAAAGDSVDLSKFVPVDTYNALATNFAALKAGSDSNSVEQLLKDNSDKVFESEISYLTDFGKQQGFAALKAMVDARPAIAALKTTQTQGKQKPEGNNTGVAALTAEQKYTADQLGLSHEDFLKNLQKETK
jgi:phage I-like protein